MIPAVLSWYLQDMVQVLMEGWGHAPDLFLFYLIFRCARAPEEETTLIWTAFLGGLLWDFRWSGLFGLNAGIFGGILALVSVLWKWIPFTGRSCWILAAFMAGSHAVLLIARTLFFGVGSKEAAFAFAVQLITAVPVILILGFVFAFRGEKRNVR